MIVGSPMFRKLLLRSLVVILVAVVVLDFLLTRYTAYHETRNAESQLPAQARILADELAGLPRRRIWRIWTKEANRRAQCPRHHHRPGGSRAGGFRARRRNDGEPRGAARSPRGPERPARLVGPAQRHLEPRPAVPGSARDLPGKGRIRPSAGGAARAGGRGHRRGALADLSGLSHRGSAVAGGRLLHFALAQPPHPASSRCSPMAW